MKVDLIQTNFTGGEMAPTIFGRSDIAQYENACEIVENFLVTPYGPLISTPGTEFINDSKFTTSGANRIYGKTRLIPFIFARDDAYVIEAGESYFRFYTDGAVVTT